MLFCFSAQGDVGFYVRNSSSEAIGPWFTCWGWSQGYSLGQMVYPGQQTLFTFSYSAPVTFKVYGPGWVESAWFTVSAEGQYPVLTWDGVGWGYEGPHEEYSTKLTIRNDFSGFRGVTVTNEFGWSTNVFLAPGESADIQYTGEKCDFAVRSSVWNSDGEKVEVTASEIPGDILSWSTNSPPTVGSTVRIGTITPGIITNSVVEAPGTNIIRGAQFSSDAAGTNAFLLSAQNGAWVGSFLSAFGSTNKVKTTEGASNELAQSTIPDLSAAANSLAGAFSSNVSVGSLSPVSTSIWVWPVYAGGEVVGLVDTCPDQIIKSGEKSLLQRCLYWFLAVFFAANLVSYAYDKAERVLAQRQMETTIVLPGVASGVAFTLAVGVLVLTGIFCAGSAAVIWNFARDYLFQGSSLSQVISTAGGAIHTVGGIQWVFDLIGAQSLFSLALAWFIDRGVIWVMHIIVRAVILCAVG